MRKLDKLNFWFLILIIATYIIPTISGLPMTPEASFYVAFWLGLLLLTNTNIFFSKGFIIGYLFLLFHIIYNFLGLYPEDRNNVRYMSDEVLPILFSFSLLEYFIYNRKSNDLRKITNFIFICTILTTITSGLALTVFPDAARELAGGIADNPALSSFYNLIGIGGFYFYIYLALLAPIYLLVIFKTNKRKFKNLFKVIYFVTFITILISQYAASISLFIITSLLTFLYLKVRSVPVYFLFVSLSIFLFLNKQIISSSIIDFSKYINLENLSPRLKNIAFLIEGSEQNQSIEDLMYKAEYDKKKDISIASFNSNIATGGGKIGDHLFWYDILGNYGLIGLLPWLLFFIYTLKTRIRLFKGDFKGIFFIVFFSLIFIGFHKPFRAFLILPYITFIIPALLLKMQNLINYNKSFFKS